MAKRKNSAYCKSKKCRSKTEHRSRAQGKLHNSLWRRGEDKALESHDMLDASKQQLHHSVAVLMVLSITQRQQSSVASHAAAFLSHKLKARGH